MFITVKDSKDTKILVNASQIKFIVPDKLKGEEIGSTIIFNPDCFVQTNSIISEIEQMISESEDTE